MANTMLNTIRRQNRVHAAKQVGRVLMQGGKAIVLGAAIYLCIIAILGFGSL